LKFTARKSTRISSPAWPVADGKWLAS
jgi:hypothetical protein